MVSKQEKGERKESSLSQLVSGIKKKRMFSTLCLGVILLAIGGIVFIATDIWIAAIACLILIIPSVFLIVNDYFKTIIYQDGRIDEIQSVIEQKEEYLSSFSHRIRTPLNNFSFIIDYLMDTSLEGNQKEMLETLIASTTNMVEAVNDLTMKTAQEISYVSRKDIKFNLFSALSSTVELFDANNDNNITFNLEQSESISNNYLGDPITIKQIFLDLFNSISSSEVGPSYVNVGFKVESKSKKRDIIRFDISTDVRIETFNYENNDRISGESMAEKLISSMSGSFSSNVAEDISLFSFNLPLQVAPEEESQSKAAERIKELNIESKEKKSLSDANVLLVEDNPTNQKIVLITLRSIVKNIDTAITGKEALDNFGKSNYDIILMDIQLPIMDGITVAKKIREIEKSTSQHTPIIAITANAMIGDKEKCLSAGMDEYLSKPFQPARLIEIIESFVTS